MRIERRINLDDFLHRAVLLQELSTARGWHNVTVSPARVKASQQAHGYYRAVVLPLAKAFLNETQGGDEDGEELDDTAAHEWLKLYLRGKPVVNRSTGEQIGVVAASHATYDSKAMAEFIDDVVKLLTDNGVRVPPAYRDHAQQRQSA